MEDGTKSDRIIEQLIVVTETSKRKTSKRKKEKKTVQQRALYSLLGNTGQSLSKRDTHVVTSLLSKSV